MKPSLVSQDQLQTQLEDLPDWLRMKSPDRIEKTFVFENYYQTMAFVNALAYQAHLQDHHPELTVGYKTCRVSYTTHSAGGLTDFDLDAARKIDGLLTS